VKKSHRWAVMAAVVLSLSYLSYRALGQGPAVAPSGQSRAGVQIALLDVGRIFKQHARFKAMMEGMKADVEKAEADVKNKRAAIAKLSENLQQFHKGTAEYNEREKQLATMSAELSVQVSLTKNQFLQNEAKIYHSVYQEICQVTDYFAKQNRIDLVLRFNSEEVDVERPDSVLSFINRPVVLYDKGLDITDQIIQSLDRSAVNPGPARGTTPLRPGVPFNR
jgi:Skp family chaperone for outer membrane proteins